MPAPYSYDRSKTASADDMAFYFETFVSTLADAFDAAMGDWSTHTITISNTNLEGRFESMARKTKAKMTASVLCDGRAVHIQATMTLPDGTAFTEKGGGSVHVGANDMGRNLAHLLSQKITRLNPANLTVMPQR